MRVRGGNDMPRQLTKVGKYVIVEKIAQGGMGAVYKAKHPTLKRFVILKQLTLRRGSGLVERFKREASLMIDFRDERIVPVYDHFKAGSSYYIVMEWIDGIGLDQLIEQKGRISNAAAVLILWEICRGLKYAHDKGVIHRDIKPANILISNEGEVKLVDFGIARTKEAEEDGLTKMGMTLGTPAYMSPEQISDVRNVDKRSDIYSLGVMFYEMITGNKPFPPDFSAAAIEKIKKGDFKNPRKYNPSIPGFFIHILRKSMNHRKKRRFRDIQSVLDILARHTKRYRRRSDVNRAIKRYISGGSISLTGKKPGKEEAVDRGRRLLKPAFVLIYALLICAGGLYFYYGGYYYELLQAKQYGRLEIRVPVPEKYYKKSDVYALARIKKRGQVDSADEMEYRLNPYGSGPVSMIRRIARKRVSKGYVTTGMIYIPAGNYTLEMVVENQKTARVFTLNPRVIQRREMSTYEGRRVLVPLPEAESRPITIDHRIRDSETGRSLYRDASILMYAGKRWIDWKKYRADRKLRKYLEGLLQSGKSYAFKYQVPRYFPEMVELYVEPNLDSVQVEVDLIKKPGVLVIESDTEGLQILIDNRKENYIGDRQKKFEEYGKTALGTREFHLPEGRYMLSLKKDMKHAESFQFSVHAEKKTRLTVSFRSDTNRIQISR